MCYNEYLALSGLLENRAWAFRTYSLGSAGPPLSQGLALLTLMQAPTSKVWLAAGAEFSTFSTFSSTQTSLLTSVGGPIVVENLQL